LEVKEYAKEIKKLASLTISIPMQNDMESLNATVSAGILMYQLKVNRR
jgi:tRNA G18 (ribose-2'-O)-methylase SpoU